ncbi:hypothetical protein DdX_16301 [Ditylenchus destructor]|uniref:Uncharacterized protein n=1 Tax=Ditylenchus destructor TaxID=166010 RepID=A0AAD4MPT2_9BILA|nr:hypothetical protein DdX_16301 [Ditylenchus destructor]
MECPQIDSSSCQKSSVFTGKLKKRGFLRVSKSRLIQLLDTSGVVEIMIRCVFSPVTPLALVYRIQGRKYHMSKEKGREVMCWRTWNRPFNPPRTFGFPPFQPTGGGSPVAVFHRQPK